jgi:4a-hydroxytetrahydrobiopterin dehydratase
MRPKKLDDATVAEAVAVLPNWTLVQGELVREWSFKDFKEAMEFVNKVAVVAEATQHHPDIDIRYNRVKLALLTHDAGGITTNDLDMAKTLNESFPQPPNM